MIVRNCRSIWAQLENSKEYKLDDMFWIVPCTSLLLHLVYAAFCSIDALPSSLLTKQQQSTSFSPISLLCKSDVPKVINIISYKGQWMLFQLTCLFKFSSSRGSFLLCGHRESILKAKASSLSRDRSTSLAIRKSFSSKVPNCCTISSVSGKIALLYHGLAKNSAYVNNTFDYWKRMHSVFF